MAVLRIIGLAEPVLRIARQRVLRMELQKLDEGRARLVVLAALHQVDRKIILDLRRTLRQDGCDGCGAKCTFGRRRPGPGLAVIVDRRHGAVRCGTGR